jgi:hypothetical protein
MLGQQVDSKIYMLVTPDILRGVISEYGELVAPLNRMVAPGFEFLSAKWRSVDKNGGFGENALGRTEEIQNQPHPRLSPVFGSGSQAGLKHQGV